MLLLSLTEKPLARRACAYSWPRMNSSVKFLVPITTGGFPAPGPFAVGWPLVEVSTLVVPEGDEDPHPYTDSATRTAATPPLSKCLHRDPIVCPARPAELRPRS